MAAQGPEPRGYSLCASLLCENQDASKTQRWPLGSVAPFFVLKIWILRAASGWVCFKIMRMTFEKRFICNYPYDRFEAKRLNGRGRFLFL